MSQVSQIDIDEKILALKKRVEHIEQLIGISTGMPEENDEAAKKTILQILSEVKNIKDQMISASSSSTTPKGLGSYLQLYSDASLTQMTCSGMRSKHRTKSCGL